MKTYDVKYDIGQEVYVISDRKIIKTIIDKIEITESRSYSQIDKHGVVEEMSGIDIRYFVMVREEGNAKYYDKIKQNDVALTPDEFIRNIK